MQGLLLVVTDRWLELAQVGCSGMHQNLHNHRQNNLLHPSLVAARLVIVLWHTMVVNGGLVEHLHVMVVVV